jgi:hypothetical protein
MPQPSAVEHSGTLQIEDIPRAARQQEQSPLRQMRIAYIYNDVAEMFLDNAETDTTESQKTAGGIVGGLSYRQGEYRSLIFGLFL